MRRSSTLLITLFGLGLTTAIAAGGGCSGDDPGGGPPGGTGGAAAGGAGGSGGGLGFDAGLEDGQVTPDTACVATTVQADYDTRPVDIIFVIDNSASMTDEILSVQNNISDHLAAVIAANRVDYRVIMVADFGDAVIDQEVCISPPLGGAPCDPLPGMPTNNDPVFFHYSAPISSYDSLCRLLDTYDGGFPDDYGFAPNGWSEWLRPDALKVFVEITDDNINCVTATQPQNIELIDGDTELGGVAVANAFDEALRGLSPANFGTADARNFVFFSLVGLRENNPPTEPYAADAPMVLNQCPTSVAPGTGYQGLSIMTGGIRFPVCEHQAYDLVFQAIADTVISGTKLVCEFSVPEPPPGESIDLSTVIVEYTPSAGGPKQFFDQVPSLAECTSTSFYIEAGTIQLCPDVCTTLQADNDAQVNVLYGCTSSTR